MIYPAHPGARDRDTSIAAADAIAPQAPNLRTATKSALAASEPHGLTADEVAAVLGLSILSIRPRVTELSRMGVIEDSGARRANQSGKRAIVWRMKWKRDLFA
tara:strand:- start:1576 stop:1884 length:309 start_codon:yes stop_codon:yes gene_type:complete